MASRGHPEHDFSLRACQRRSETEVRAEREGQRSGTASSGTERVRSSCTAGSRFAAARRTNSGSSADPTPADLERLERHACDEGASVSRSAGTPRPRRRPSQSPIATRQRASVTQQHRQSVCEQVARRAVSPSRRRRERQRSTRARRWPSSSAKAAPTAGRRRARYRRSSSSAPRYVELLGRGHRRCLTSGGTRTPSNGAAAIAPSGETVAVRQRTPSSSGDHQRRQLVRVAHLTGRPRSPADGSSRVRRAARPRCARSRPQLPDPPQRERLRDDAAHAWMVGRVEEVDAVAHLVARRPRRWSHQVAQRDQGSCRSAGGATPRAPPRGRSPPVAVGELPHRAARAQQHRGNAYSGSSVRSRVGRVERGCASVNHPA